MIAALILWGHALAALLFAAAAGAAWRRPRGGSRAMVAALLLTALWSLATAGIDPRDLGTRLAEAARDLAWLGFTYTLVGRARAGHWAFGALCLVVAAVVLAAAGLAVAQGAAHGSTALAALATARLLFRMMAAAGALILVHHLHAAAAAPAQRGVRLIAVALGALWAADLLVCAAAYVGGAWLPELAAGRGFAMAGVALLLAAATDRRDSGALGLSRPAALRALGAMALVVYVGLAAEVARFVGAMGGDHARALQAGVVVGAVTALLTLLSTSWLGAWTRVKLAKHLFRHRYDYRIEWQRFTDTLGGAGASLEERVVQAVAQLFDAPGGLLLTADGPAIGWRWDERGEPLAPPLVDLLTGTRRIVDLDAVRAGTSPRDAALPAWLRAASDAWLVAPLMHGDALAGAVVLARPPVRRALDWEDFDLLRVAGRQAASYLAEDRAGRALAEAQRFDEFNRRFAFILHDIKNLVSQQQLVARNAERHAANPAFRADMVATLKDSADRMTALLARLSHREPASEPLGPVDCAALAARVARARGAHHRVEADGAGWATARPLRLEQVLGHLVQNAVEAGAADAAVTLRVTAAAGRIAIDVVDHGAGMSAAFVRDELFRPFASTKPGGFGIGAFEARQLVIGMGGTLEVDSQEGVGTRFRVGLPAAVALEEAA